MRDFELKMEKRRQRERERERDEENGMREEETNDKSHVTHVSGTIRSIGESILSRVFSRWCYVFSLVPKRVFLKFKDIFPEVASLWLADFFYRTRYRILNLHEQLRFG